MAVTTIYAFETGAGLDLSTTNSGMELTGLANGGLAGLGTHDNHVDLTYFNSDLQEVGDNTQLDVADGSLDQLVNGNIIVAGQTAAGLSFKITDTLGDTLVGPVAIADTNSSRVDVAALTGGGFVIASQDNFTATDNDIDLRIYQEDGGGLISFVVNNSAANDTGASVAGLNDGGFAVAWTRTIGAETELWYAIYEVGGGVRKAGTLLDTFGTTNTGASVVALDNGGFAIAYTDNGWDGSPEISLARLSATGVHNTTTRITESTIPATAPSLTRLSNGMLVVTYSAEYGPGDHDIYAQLIDQTDGTTLLETPYFMESEVVDSTDSSAAAWGLAGLAASYLNGAADVRTAQLIRQSTGDALANNILGDDAVDRMFGGDLNDTLSGMANDDSLQGQSGSDSLLGGAGADSLFGGIGSDVLRGEAGEDLMNGGTDGDFLDGGLGDDTMLGESGVDTLVGGDGADSLAAGADADSLDGGLGDDTMLGEGGADTMQGGDGKDSLVGAAEADSLDGGLGADTMLGEAGADTLLGGDGDDWLKPGADNDSLDGGLANDTADYSDAAGAVTVDLGHFGQQNTGGSGLDRLINVEHLIGGAGADALSGDGLGNRLTGLANNDTLTGVGGADTLDGGGGADSLNGGANNDTVMAGFGADTMVGGGGFDVLDYSIFASETFLNLNDSAAQNTHSAGSDTVIGFETVVTGGGDDRLRGNGSANRLLTLGGADTIKAGGGSDTLLGGNGDDVLNGGGDQDLVAGNAGRDEMRGGAGSDVFDFISIADGAVGVAACDVIRDFRTSDLDLIDLSTVDPGDLTYIGSAAFGGVGTHEVRVTTVAQGQLVQVDIDGDGDSDMDILVVNSGLSGGAADFLL